MITAYDFETTGFVDFKKRSADPTQPHIVSMGLVQYDDGGTEISRRQCYVRPDGWESEPDALRTHGLTNEFLTENGIPEDHVIALWLLAMVKSRIRVAHNENFDCRVARIAMTRAGYERDIIESLEARPKQCTMRMAYPILNIAPTDKMMAAGVKMSKSPSLADCLSYFFDETRESVHGALEDADAAGRLYWHMVNLAQVA